MPDLIVYRDDFSAGMLSRPMLARVASQPYAQGVVGAMNMIPTKTGSMKSIPGTYRIPGVSGEDVSRVEILYSLDGRKAYRVVFTANKVTIFRAWTPTAASVSNSASSFTMAESELYDMQVLVVRGMMWVVHPNHPPQTIAVEFPGGVETFFYSTPEITSGPASAPVTIFESSGDFPAAIGYHASRIFFGNTDNDPNGIWVTRQPVDGTWGFTKTTADCTYEAVPAQSDGFYTSEGSMGGSKIAFFASLDRLVVGTTRGLYIATTDYISGASIQDLGVQEFDLIWANGIGAEVMSPVHINKTMFFVGVGGRTLYGAEWGGDAGLQVADFTRFNSEILKPRVRNLAAMQNPYPSIWMTLKDGTGAVCAADPQNALVGFSPLARAQATGVSRLNSWVSIVRGDIEDRVFWEVTENPSTETGGLLQAPFDFELDDIGDGQPHCVDRGGYLHDTGGTGTVTDASLIDGATYDIWADYCPLPIAEADSGALTLDREAVDIHYGLPMEVWFAPTIPDIPVKGSGQAQVRGITKLIIRVIDSYGGAAGPALDELVDFVYMIAGDYILGDPLPATTGDVDVDVFIWNDRNPTLYIAQPLPAPIEVAAAIMWVSVTEEG